MRLVKEIIGGSVVGGLIVTCTLVAIFVSGCAGIGTPGENVGNGAVGVIKYVHDDAHKVGCWFYAGGNGSISCLSDKDYTVGQ